MEFEDIYVQIVSSKKRPVFLSRLCLITFFFSGSMTLFSFGGLFLSGWMANYINFFVKGFYNVGSNILIVFFLSVFVLFGSSLVGALLMFRLKRSGYWIYLSANAIMILLSFFVVLNFINILFIVVSVVFILLYRIPYKHMKSKA